MALRAGRGRPARRPPLAAALLAAALLAALLLAAAAPAAAQAAFDCASLGAGAAPKFTGCQVLKPGVAALLWRFDRKATTIYYRIAVKPQPSDNLGWFAVGQSDMVSRHGRGRRLRARALCGGRRRRVRCSRARSAKGWRHGGRERKRAAERLRNGRPGVGGRQARQARLGQAVAANAASTHCPRVQRPPAAAFASPCRGA
jgi:opacity protein-like surface antigen